MKTFEDIPTPPDATSTVVVDLPTYGALPETKHVLDRASALALKAALATGRPLLLRGEPGIGKSQLARVAAAVLDRRLLTHTVDARTEPRDLLYTVDAVSRLAHAQLAGARSVSKAASLQDIDVMNFVQPGPLWWAYDPAGARVQAITAKASVPTGAEGEGGVVLLIDEIDKADPSVPNGLLDAFGNGSFSVEGRRGVEAVDPRPLVILTTNEERSLPDAFVRRCLVLTLALPKLPEQRDAFVAALVARGEANDAKCERPVLAAAAEAIADDRIALKSHGVCLPGVAEYLDLLRAVATLAKEAKAQQMLLGELRQLATRKHPQEGDG
ncbi:MAG: MoxR family ATPase [Polyangiales bacterium]